MQKKYTLSLVVYEWQIKIVDAQIDQQVYDLYGLTEEEVKVVEGSIK